MATVSYDGRAALGIAAKNKQRAWGNVQDRGSARARFEAGDYLTIGHKPKFEIDNTSPVFTIGSCFAREVEHTLVRLGIPLALQGHGIQAEYYQSWDEERARGGGVRAGQKSRGAFNKYNVFSISSELKRVLLEQEFPNDGLIEIAEDKWFDPHASRLRLLPFETARQNRAIINHATSQIRQSKTVVMTLGLTEGWIDAETGLAINTPPEPGALRRHSSRFQFVDYGFREVADELNETIQLIKERCVPDVRIVITVSPVPLGSTFQDVDVIVANTGSKSTLRSVANEMRHSFDFVDYFPSYEMVMNSPRHMAFGYDHVHIKPDMVKHIMSVFKGAYFPAAPDNEAA
ncbi:GSCFA family protein [Hyphomicrobiales bacterium]|nr:GSCFA family protein [Hyphomicrobiales bacterium]CAH1670394.1 GSCFA family protein [Hyphomicrobiales bacterium]